MRFRKFAFHPAGSLARQDHLRRKFRRRAAALIVVLSVILLLTVLVVSFTVALRMDRQASHYYVQKIRAEAFAREGVESAKGILLAAIGSTNRSWVSMPGRVLAWNASQTISNAATYDLYSADDSSQTNDFLAAHDFNPRVLTEDSLSLLTGEGTNAAAMKIGWIYILKDGTRQTTTNSAANNPVIGRFAFWTDDETARINLNTAWKRQANLPANHPSQLPLQALSSDLSDEMIDQIHSEALRAGFNSPDEVRRITGLGTLLSSNRFSVTHSSHSSDLNPFGEPKIYLTTQLANLPPGFTNIPGYTNYFLDILNSDNADPGLASNINPAKYKARLDSLRTSILARTNWPYAGGNFTNKYGGSALGGRNSVQMAADIIGYVRSAESSSVLVQSITIDAQNPDNIRTDLPGDSGLSAGLQSTNLILEAVRRPMFCEIGVHVSDYLVTNNRYHYTGKAALYFPPSYGIPASSLEGKTLNWQVNYEATPGTWLSKTLWNAPITPAMIDAGSHPNFAVVTCEADPPLFTGQSTNRPTSLYFSILLTQGAKIEHATIARYNLTNTTPAQAAILKNAMISCPVDPVGLPLANITTVKVNDPRVNKYGTNWNSTGPSNWGSLPPRTDVSSTPRQDMDGGGISDAGLFLRAPKGHPLNPYGMVESVAELGFIRSGGGPGLNVPWRSLALRPTPSSESPPDWLLLDMFAAPVQPTNHVVTARGNIAGRINLNSAVFFPFTNTLVGTNLRLAPLRSFFLGTTNLGLTPDEAAGRVASMTNFAHSYGPTNYYASIGRLAEISGIGSANKKDEDLLRQVVDQATVQGNVFRVHAVGQALKQTPSSQIVIQAECSLETIIERDRDGNFHVIYWRTLPL